MLDLSEKNMEARGETKLAKALSEQESKETSPGDMRQRRSVSTDGDDALQQALGAGSTQSGVTESSHPSLGRERREVPLKSMTQPIVSVKSSGADARLSASVSPIPASSKQKDVSLAHPHPIAKAATAQDVSLKETVPDLGVTSYTSLEKSLKPGTTSLEQNDASRTLKPQPRSLSPDEDSELQKGRPAEVARSREKLDNNSPPKVIVTTTPAPLPVPVHVRTSWKPKVNALRRGKWTVEEEAYVARVIQDFNSGFLDAPAGTTLRTYLSTKLQCDPMRITKKFTGDACIGKRVFHPAVRSPSNSAAIDTAQAELEALESRWRRRLEMQQRESAKKAVAARARAASFDGSHGSKHNAVAQTASWLDRAKSVLKEPSTAQSSTSRGAPSHSEKDDLQTQMNEVQRLIREGPTIQQTSAGLSNILDEAAAREQHHSPPEDQAVSPGNSVTEPADKRLRTAEDAEALVGFLRSVRASAAAGQDI